MKDFARRVEENNGPLGDGVEFVLDGASVGQLQPEFAELIASYDSCFAWTSASKTSLGLAPVVAAGSCDERTAAVAEVTASLKERGVVTGWRDELVTVATRFDAPPALMMERAAYPLFGIKGYGAHLNGFVRCPDGQTRLWIGKRAATKQTWPGKRDHLVAGQIGGGLSPQETIIKECFEEAGIPEPLARTSRPVGFVSYRGQDEQGRLKNDVLFCFDLELPADFKPEPVDGEVESFELMDLEAVADLIQASPEDPGAFKPNVNLVIIDFLVRHGFVPPDAPGYLPLVASLKSGPCS